MEKESISALLGSFDRNSTVLWLYSGSKATISLKLQLLNNLKALTQFCEFVVILKVFGTFYDRYDCERFLVDLKANPKAFMHVNLSNCLKFLTLSDNIGRHDFCDSVLFMCYLSLKWRKTIVKWAPFVFANRTLFIYTFNLFLLICWNLLRATIKISLYHLHHQNNLTFWASTAI